MNRRIPKPSTRKAVIRIAMQCTGYLLSLLCCAFTVGAIFCGCSAPSESLAPATSGYVFFPQDDLDEAVNAAARSIQVASGIYISAGESDVIVRRWNDSDVEKYPGECAHTSVDYYSDNLETFGIQIAVKSPLPAGCAWDLFRIVQHEMIHAVRAWDFAEEDPNEGHSSDGVFQATDSGTGLLEETSLTALCDRAQCTRFAPEE